ncbi:MAG TPA: hypothetical protein DG757_04065 [Bacillus sp. (in: Bacteria)]|uniref:Uncharacterized protein n=1 Tax=Anoxybacillus andreesenii TaxID=1325932 RepID=A0ABT9V3D0_9BACL|nr:hypothetical protein [Robertmurraya andreesenii]MDQ0155450.1 hypothetical protein [Robertmurraya andreesenii]HCX48214.1 hypothetical protein [Bacillus sp. (in: firmicutes)]
MKFILGSICFSFLLFIGISVNAEKIRNEKEQLILYPANRDKVIRQSPDQFYKELQTEFHYKEYSGATLSKREKVLFKDIDKFVYKYKDGEVQYSYPDSNIKEFYPAPNPNRQVYFLMSVKETEKEFKGQYAIYDAETKQFISLLSCFRKVIVSGC